MKILGVAGWTIKSRADCIAIIREFDCMECISKMKFSVVRIVKNVEFVRI